MPSWARRLIAVSAGLLVWLVAAPARAAAPCAIIEEPSRLPPPPCSTRPSRRSMWASRPTAWTFTLSTRASTRTPARVNPPRSSRTSTRRCSQGACRSRPQASYRTSCSRCPCGRRPACEVGSNGRPEDSAPPRGASAQADSLRRWKAVERNARALCARARNTATARFPHANPCVPGARRLPLSTH